MVSNSGGTSTKAGSTTIKPPLGPVCRASQAAPRPGRIARRCAGTPAEIAVIAVEKRLAVAHRRPRAPVAHDQINKRLRFETGRSLSKPARNVCKCAKVIVHQRLTDMPKMRPKQSIL